MAEQEANGLEIEPVEVEVEIEVEQVGEIQVLLDFIDSPNIAEDIDEDTLRLLGGQVCEDFNRDDDSMSDWADMVEFGQDLAKQERFGKSEPWEGASNPLLSLKLPLPLVIEPVPSYCERVI